MALYMPDLFGVAVFVVLTALGVSDPLVAFPTVATVFGLRLTAVRLDLHFPSPRTKELTSPDEGR